MTEFSAASNQPSESARARIPWLSYLFLALAANAAIWGAAFLYLSLAQPIYSSKWTLTLPGTGSSSNVSLPDIGSASSDVQSAYNSADRDPRETYKYIAESEPVRRAAAEQINLPVDEFEKPRIKILDNSTLMSFEVRAESPQKAQQQSLAIYQALQSRLNELRIQEAAQQNATTESTLIDSRRKLELAQKRLSEYKARSGLTSNEQISQLSSNIEDLRRRKAEALAQESEASARVGELSGNLNVSASQAADAFVLNEDPLFKQYRQDYSQATAALSVLISKYGPNHPSVVRERARQQATQAALATRSGTLLGQPATDATLDQLNVGNGDQTGSARETLFQELVTVQVQQQGHRATAEELERQIAQLEGRLQQLGQYESTLEGLRRDLQIAETVFSSTLTSLDLGRSEVFGTYPRIQLLTEPSLPGDPTSPNKLLALLGAASGSLLFTVGLFLLGWRTYRLNKRQALQTEKRDKTHPESDRLVPEPKSEVLGLSNSNK